MNRLSIENLTLGIATEINVHISPPFLLYQNKTSGEPPYGIWFYSQYDCSRISQLVKKLHSEVENEVKLEVQRPAAAESKVKPPPGLNLQPGFPASSTTTSEPKQENKVDILGEIFTDQNFSKLKLLKNIWKSHVNLSKIGMFRTATDKYIQNTTETSSSPPSTIATTTSQTPNKKGLITDK